MKDYNFSQDEQKTIANYNNELWSKFIKNVEIAFIKLTHDKKHQLTPSLDLIRAINSYRIYLEPEELMKAFPELENQKESIELLWNHFRNLSEEELGDLMIQMIHEVSL